MFTCLNPATRAAIVAELLSSVRPLSEYGSTAPNPYRGLNTSGLVDLIKDHVEQCMAVLPPAPLRVLRAFAERGAVLTDQQLTEAGVADDAESQAAVLARYWDVVGDVHNQQQGTASD
jgi:hypothetical protein